MVAPQDQPKPHISFQKMNVERPRYKPQRVIPRPERNNVQYGTDLDEAVNVLQRTFSQTTTTQPPEFNPALIFRLRLEGYIDEDEWRRSGLTLLSKENDSGVVLFSEDQLAQFRQRIEAYGQEVPEGQISPSYNWLASVTREMVLWGRDDRTGRKLARITMIAKEIYRVDVELWHYGSRDDCLARMEQLRDFVVHNNGEFLDRYVGSALSIARVKISGEVLERLLDVGIVQTVDLPPEPHLTVGQLLQTALDDFPTPISPPSDDAPGVCVIDSGINRGHPMLGAAIGYTRSIPVDAIEGLDQHGHGTMVAGIALYGDVKRCIESLNFEPQLYLFGARVTNAENKFDDERLIVTQMKEAIEAFHDEYGCRVFNVSLGDPGLVYNDGKPSPWAYILDTLARDLDVVIVVSAGNLSVLGVFGDEANQIFTEYPRYLLNDDSRLIEPATAANVLTVGALAHSDVSHLMSRRPNDPSVRCVADIDQPSPFTRCGLGVGNAIKPEVCDYGGNVTWEAPGRILDRDPEVSIISTSYPHLERLFTADVGTSLAAPRVAHLAGLIMKDYPGISANLVRALIANSASVPDPVKEILTDDDDILRICGYGQPNLERALYSAEGRVTLIAEDEIPLDAIHLYEIPIPEEFQQTSGKRCVMVSLAFDSPVRHTRSDYLGVKMSFRLFRGLSTEQIIDWYAERQSDADPDKIPNRNECSMTPTATRRERGTLQKAVFVAAQNRAFSNYSGDTFHLLVRCQAGWASPEQFPHQRYALAVTVEHLEEPIELYNIVTQRVQLPERVRLKSA